MAPQGLRHAPMMAILAAAVAIPGAASGDDEAGFVMPPVLQVQAANGLSDEDILRVLARDNLMLTAAEAAQIDAALRAREMDLSESAESTETIPAPLAARRYFRLDALLYFSPSSWSLWLNGALVTPTKVPPDVRINAISPDYVEIVWLPESTAAEDRRIFTLRPKQVYMAESDEVVDSPEVALNEPDMVLPSVIVLESVESDAVPSDRRARPEELTLTSQQVDQLRDLESALEAQQ